eukprot:2933046-Prymnesium_polylepis.1
MCRRTLPASSFFSQLRHGETQLARVRHVRDPAFARLHAGGRHCWPARALSPYRPAPRPDIAA